MYKMIKVTDNKRNMRKLNSSQSGFITMIIILVALLVAVVLFAYLRVKNAK